MATVCSSTVTLRSVMAHDIPDERVDRALQIRLEPPTLRVSYAVSLSEWTLFQDLKRLSPEATSGRGGNLIERYTEVVAPLNARGLLASVDATDLSWRLDRSEVDYDRHPTLTFHFEANLPPSGRLLLRDTNYSGSYGTSRLAFAASPTTTTTGYGGPADLADVPERPSWSLTDEEEVGTRQVDIVYRPASVASLEADPGPPPSAPVSPTQDDRTEWSGEDRLTRLFWGPSARPLPLLLIAAFLIGAAHAVQPGHGKTVVVGASIQGPRPIARGLLLAGSAATAHFAVAVGLAVIALIVAPSGIERINGVVTRAIGLVLAIVGSWRIGSSWDFSRTNAEAPGQTIGSSRDALIAGLAIGAIPCWDAVLLLGLSWVAGQVMLGVALVAAFGLGASVMLLSVALVAGLFRSVAARLTTSPVLERSLGMVGGLLLAGIGAYLFLS